MVLPSMQHSARWESVFYIHMLLPLLIVFLPRWHVTVCVEMPPVTGSKETVLVSPSTSRISFSRAHWSQQGRAMCTGICCLVLLYHPVEQAGCMVLSSAIWPHVLLLENDFFMLTIPFFLLASKCRVCTRTHHHPF